ncbi:oligosaccharide flippase family protein [Jiangella gansuensis]|uniref:oligosaccharide flippase family protein n=1 Tax=Jiangella gansuensis TaxID=281473 RepID=UPI00047E2AE7|nr:oligosaccharide flippase family protein [Jiangella gansuensis]
MPQLARRLLGAGLRSSAGTLAAGTSLANALGYILTVVAARRLGPDEFGAFSALLALVVVGNVAALAVQATTARGVATGRAVAPVVRSGLVMAVALGAALCLLSPVTKAALRLDSVVPAIAAAVAIAALAATAPSFGVVQGRERFRLLGALVTIQAALRVGGGLAGMALHPSAAAALIGTAVGFVLAGAVAWTAARPPLVSPDGGFAVRATLSSGAMLLGFVVLTNIDVVLARHVLPAEASGLYAAGSIFTKIAFWLPQFVPTLAFPALADPERRRGAVALGVASVAGCGALLTALSWLFADPGVHLVAGPDYGDVVAWVPGFAGLGALYALAHLLVYAHLARGDRWTTAVLWTVLAGYTLTVEVWATDLAGVLVPGLVAAGLVVLWSLVRERAPGRARTRSPHEHRHSAT